MVFHNHATVIGDKTNFCPGQIHLSKIRLTSSSPLVHDDQHALLGFAEHDFIRSHVRGSLRHLIEFNLDAGASLAAVSQVEQVNPAAPVS